jgi:hypothetical protein
MLAGEGNLSAPAALWWEHTPRTPATASDSSAIMPPGHDYAARLLGVAGTQLAERGCALAVGPDGSTWREYRMIVERDPNPIFHEPTIPQNGRATSSLWLRRPGALLLAAEHRSVAAGPGLPDVLRHESLGISVRHEDGRSGGELTAIHALTIECCDAFLFTPVSREIFSRSIWSCGVCPPS